MTLIHMVNNDRREPEKMASKALRLVSIILPIMHNPKSLD